MTPIERAAFLYSFQYPERAVRDCEREGISEADMAAGFAIAEQRQLDYIIDAQTLGAVEYGSRQVADRSANHLAPGIENRLAGGVANASVSDLPEGLGFE